MDVVYQRCCGLDVHQKTVVACVVVSEGRGKKRKEVRTFSTVTKELEGLSGWLEERNVTHVAMEATGVYWKPVWNVLDGQFELLLANVRHIKAVPGRKTDVKDCEWIADLLQHGLLRGSFVPPQEIQDLRELTRYRTQVTQERTAVTNRIQKVLEGANIKLASVASDVLGASGRKMLEALIDGQKDAEQLADMAQRRMRSKIPELRLALQGNVREHHQILLRSLMEHWKFLEGQIASLDEKIETSMVPFEGPANLWQTVPGISKLTAWNLVAEIGVNMDQFPSAQHLASWAGLCPGNNESAGKRLSGRARHGNLWLKRIACQAAWAASHSKRTYCSAQYRRLAGRRGKKRAIIAVAHTLLVAGYSMLKNSCPYQDLGENYFDRINRQNRQRYHVNRLRQLGFIVKLEAVEHAA